MNRRTRMGAAQRRAQLLDVAGGLFSRHGYHGASMEALADAAGVSKPVLYQHFPSKRHLYLALVTGALSGLQEHIREALEGTTDNKARVEGAIGAYFDFVEDPRFRLLFTTAELADDTVRGAFEQVTSGLAATVAGLIGQDAGLSQRSAQFLATAVLGLAVDGARWWVEHPDVDKDEAVRLLTRLVWRGLGSFTPSQVSDA